MAGNFHCLPLLFTSMADNFLERHKEKYEQRKASLQSRKQSVSRVKRNIQKPDDEAL